MRDRISKNPSNTNEEPGVLTLKKGFRDYYPVLVCSVLFLLVLNIRWRVFHDFCILITDSDQLLLWDAANDIHKGIFHEPCFYGQSYSPLVEPVFAQPFIFFGMPLRIALPLVSGVSGLLPFFLLGYAFFKKKKYLSAAFAFAYLLWLPLEFHALDSIPRGYVPACAIASIAVYLVLFTESKTRFSWFGFLGLLAFSISQNCVFLLFPLFIYLVISNFKDRQFYIKTGLGALCVAPLPLFIYWFYHSHPAYDFHPLNFALSVSAFTATLKGADTYLNFLTPDAGYKLACITGFYIFFAIICFLNNNSKYGISMIGAVLLLYFSFCFNKTQEGTSSLYFSSVRMFLGVPLGFLVFAYWAESSITRPIPVSWKILSLTFLLVIGIICSPERLRYFREKLLSPSSGNDVVAVIPVVKGTQDCNHLDSLCRAYHSGLVITENGQIYLDYMCPALNYPFKILKPSYERRTWEMQQEDTTKRDVFIFLPYYPQFAMQYSPVVDIKPTYDPNAFLVVTHGRKVFNVLKDLKAPVRAH